MLKAGIAGTGPVTQRHRLGKRASGSAACRGPMEMVQRCG
jgi:hypothetical protein